MGSSRGKGYKNGKEEIIVEALKEFEVKNSVKID